MRKQKGGLSRKQQAAIVALLGHSALKDAAEECGVSVKTLVRWLQLKTFKAELQAAQRTVFDEALAELQSAIRKAVRQLVINVRSTNAHASNQACLAILSNAFKARETADIGRRLEELEELVADLEKGWNARMRPFAQNRAAG